MAHIDVTRDADAILIAPCSATSSQAGARRLRRPAVDHVPGASAHVPLLVAPAMNVEMWQNPATQRNVQQLRDDGIVLFGPAGDQACGEVGMGRMLEPEQLLEEVIASFQPKVLAGKRI
jgi:phosphopantothenoylcysteine decarboxylase/phosphopantothenate--cysteine ligase